MATNNRRSFPNFNSLRPFIQAEFKRRRQEYPSPIGAPFIKLTSCMVDSVHQPQLSYFTLGLHGFDLEDIDIFSASHTNNSDLCGYAYSNGNKVLVYSSDLTVSTTNVALSSKIYTSAQIQQLQSSNQQSFDDQKIIFAKGAHPIPGIISAKIDRTALGLPTQISVKYVCYNRAQLEFLRNQFMIAGAHVVLEWGTNYSDVNNQLERLDFSNDNVINELVASIKQGREYVIDNWAEPNNGNYDFSVGSVSNFKVELDAESGIYTCTTEIVAQGESFRGITIFSTYFDKLYNQNRDTTTMSDFFKKGGGFDRLVQTNSSDQTLVSNYHTIWDGSKNINIVPDDLKQFSMNPEDYKYVSWKFFAQTLMTALFDLIKDPVSKATLPSLIDFMGNNPGGVDQQSWIGNNPFLKSTMPDTMLLFNMAAGTLHPNEFLGAGYFDDTGGGPHRGKLNKGVWLEIGMIRQCFLSANTMELAITNVLSRMSSATDNYWDLSLFFDDEVGIYKIIDQKFGDPNIPNDFYTFNLGGQSETLSIDLDSAFPPELVTQMMLYGLFQSETEADQLQQLQSLPALGTPSSFIFSMNWTNLKDKLQMALNAVSQEAIIPFNSDGNNIVTYADAFNSTKSRVVPIVAAPADATFTNTMKVIPDKPIGSNSVVGAAGSNDVQVNPVRNSVTNTFSSSPLDIDWALNDPNVDGNFAQHLQQLITYIETTYGMNVVINETYRTAEREMFLYNIGRDGNPGYDPNQYGPAPNVKQVVFTENPMGSYHLTGQAADLVIFKPTTKGPTSSAEMVQTGASDAQYVDTQQFYPTLLSILTSSPDLRLTTIGSMDPGHIQVFFEDKNVYIGPKISTNLGNNLNQLRGIVSQDDKSVEQIRVEDQQQQAEDAKARATDIKNRFGDSIVNIIELNPANMTAKIAKDGYGIPNQPNNHILAFPTTTKIGITTQGIGGISWSDGFMVDKIPFVFERYGCFQTVGIEENITPDGWITKIQGVFKLLWLNGDGNKQPSTASQPVTPQ